MENTVIESLKRDVLDQMTKAKGNPGRQRKRLVSICLDLGCIAEDGRIMNKTMDVIEHVWGADLPQSEINQIKVRRLKELIEAFNHWYESITTLKDKPPLYIRIEGDHVITHFDKNIVEKEQDRSSRKNASVFIDRHWREGYFLRNGLDLESMKIFQADANNCDEWQNDAASERRERDFSDWRKYKKAWTRYPGASYGVYSIADYSFASSPQLEFTLFPTDHFNFLATQSEFKQGKKQLSKHLNVRKPIPKFAHSISPVGFLIVKDDKEYAIFAKRTDKVDTGQERIGLPVCITPHREPSSEEAEDLQEWFKTKGLSKQQIERQLQADSTENDGSFFVDTLVRGAEDELGIILPRDAIKIVAYGLDTERYLYSVIAMIRIEMGIAELKIRSENSVFGKDQHRLVPVEFEPHEIARYIQGLKKSEYCPTTQMAAYYACLSEYGSSAVADAFGSLRA